MASFQNQYDTNGKPVCPTCQTSVLDQQPAARSGSHISHLHCLWKVAEPEQRDKELSAFFATLKGVLARVQAIRAAISAHDSGKRDAA